MGIKIPKLEYSAIMWNSTVNVKNFIVEVRKWNSFKFCLVEAVDDFIVDFIVDFGGSYASYINEIWWKWGNSFKKWGTLIADSSYLTILTIFLIFLAFLIGKNTS